MENFPIISQTQVVLYRAEHSTGIILDNQFKKYSEKDTVQQVYTVFNSLEEAIEYVKLIFEDRMDTEFVILDSTKKVLKYISPKNWKEML